MEDISRRLDKVETGVSELKPQVAGILAMIPHLATKADVAAVMTNVAKMESAIIKWIIATVLTSTTAAFTIAKFVH